MGEPNRLETNDPGEGRWSETDQLIEAIQFQVEPGPGQTTSAFSIDGFSVEGGVGLRHLLQLHRL